MHINAIIIKLRPGYNTIFQLRKIGVNFKTLFPAFCFFLCSSISIYAKDFNHTNASLSKIGIHFQCPSFTNINSANSDLPQFYNETDSKKNPSINIPSKINFIIERPTKKIKGKPDLSFYLSDFQQQLKKRE